MQHRRDTIAVARGDHLRTIVAQPIVNGIRAVQEPTHTLRIYRNL